MSSRQQLSSDIEPLVGLIEQTTRDKLLEEVAVRIRQGLGYQDLLSALFLAGVCDIEPRPVGYKFHAVMVVNAAHLSSIAGEEANRWLPLFWALDNFKSAQAKNQREGGWYMKPSDEAKVPPASSARQRFVESMDNWDEEGADLAITSLVRNCGATEVIELLWYYGARDFRDIGHKAIYTAHAWRILQVIGWRHAEPVVRSLAYAFMEHEGANPANRDEEADRHGRENNSRLKKIRPGWQQGSVAPQSVTDFLSSLRVASSSEACDEVVRCLNKEVSPVSLWDALFLQAAELLMRKPGIIGVHCVTSINALHYGYQASGNDETRRFLLLQAAAFLPQFRKFMGLGDITADRCIDLIEKLDVDPSGNNVIEEIFADANNDAMHAARKSLGFLAAGGDPLTLMSEGRRLICNKATDSHDYKFSSAAFEDYFNMTPSWRDRYLCASMFNLRSSLEPDNELGGRIQNALG